MRISSVHIQSTGEDQLLVEDDLQNIYPWMSNTDGYKMARRELSLQKSGTAVLLEGMHKIEREIGKEVDRDDYIDEIISRLKSQIGLTFHRYLTGKAKIKRTDGTFKQIDRIKILINGAPIHPLDPFFSDFTDSATNHWTLKRKLFTKTLVDGEEVQLDASAYIIPKQTEIQPKAKILEKKLLKVRPKISRGELQGIYLFRHQRLIDFASKDPWKTLGKSHTSTVVGRWEIHLPPHEPHQLGDLDFTLDKTKTDTSFGETTKESLIDYFSSSTFSWHPLDFSAVGTKKRMEFRTARSPSKPMELKCSDCVLFGHANNLTKMPAVNPPIPGGTGGSGGTGGTGGSGGSGGSGGTGGSGGSGGTGGSGTAEIKEVGVGDLTKADGSKVKINFKPPLFNGVKDWFKQQP